MMMMMMMMMTMMNKGILSEYLIKAITRRARHRRAWYSCPCP
jgi:hypothetical protein